MKLFKTNNLQTVRLRQEYLGIDLPSIQLSKRGKKFDSNFMIIYKYIYYCDMTGGYS